MRAHRIVDAGRHAVLVEMGSTDEAAVLAAQLREPLPAGVDDVVGAMRTVLVRGPSTADALRAVVAERLSSVSGTAVGTAAETAVIPVVYDGDDLADVGMRCGLSVEDVVAAHAGATYTVAFCGFAPGFAYLTGLPTELALPRRATPRPRVPAGSVAIAGDLSAVYPTASPGGWHLLGRTDVTLFDPERTPPALLAPGTTVRFEPR